MEIQALRLRVTDQDLNDLARELLPDDQPAEELSLRIAPEGVYVKGQYPLFVTVSFELLWEPSVTADGRVALRLARLKALGVPATALKCLVLNVVENSVKENPSAEVSGERIVLDLNRLLADRGIALCTNLAAIRCETGFLTIEAGVKGVASC